jgi:mannose-6-phosphate isomerase-like protein (cupin superfamily)
MTANAAKPATLPTWRSAPDSTRGKFEGGAYGSEISCFVVDAEIGEGPDLHYHPYSETFIILGGRGLFRNGELEVVATAGDVVVVQAGNHHLFRSLGPERLRLVGIHAAPEMQQTDIPGGAPAPAGD